MSHDDRFETRLRAILSGEDARLRASMLRGVLTLAQWPYRGVTTARNRMFEAGIKAVHRLDRPVVSVGNLTTGGTGKTPAVQWIVRSLLAAGHRPAVLMRGYAKTKEQLGSDEELLLRETLACPVYADPDRVQAGQRLIREHPDVDVIVLDDGFQHRRLHRHVDLVLIDATQPFGYGHVLPRGLLRESMAGLARADGILLTRTDLATPESLEQIVQTIRRHNDSVPILRSTHELSIDPAWQTVPTFAFNGIGNPAAFTTSLRRAGVDVVGMRAFKDHHAYTTADLEALQIEARRANARQLLTTAKDWMKVRTLLDADAAQGTPSARPGALPIRVVPVELRLNDSDTVMLGSLIRKGMQSA